MSIARKALAVLFAVGCFAVTFNAQAAQVTYAFEADVSVARGDESVFEGLGLISVGSDSGSVSGQFSFDDRWGFSSGQVQTTDVVLTRANGAAISWGSGVRVDSAGRLVSGGVRYRAYESVVVWDLGDSSGNGRYSLSLRDGRSRHVLSGGLTSLTKLSGVPGGGPGSGGAPTGVPELSAGSAASSLGLLAGGALVVSARRRESGAA